MKIYSSESPEKESKKFIYLKKNDWDDYSYQSTFNLFFYNGSKKIAIGEVKIIDSTIEKGRVLVGDGINELGGNYCSLGQSKDYYRNLKKLEQEEYEHILKSINDCAYDEKIYNLFKELDQFKSSAVRFSTAEQALNFGMEIFNRKDKTDEKPSHSFKFSTKLKGFHEKHNLDFKFFKKSEKEIPSSINVIIGRNGTGKTQLLSDLAKTISGYGFKNKKELIKSREEKIEGIKPDFGHVIVISYSAFDSFDIPGNSEQEINELENSGHIHGYKYCGLRERIDGDQYRLKSTPEITDDFIKSFKKIKEQDKVENWFQCIEHVLTDPSFQSLHKENLIKSFKKLSSGQKIILSILAGVYEHIEKNSLIILDEPETHLHPSLMSAFMHSLRDIIESHESYAIIATHSPVVLQETPSMFVQILGGSPNRPTARRLKLESFGEEISTLTEEVFKVPYEEANFYKTLSLLSEKGYSILEIEKMFEMRLGFTARSFIKTL